MAAIIRVNHLCKDYSGDGDAVHALTDVSLEIQAGEFVALMGPSGCGKSTLLHIVGAMDRATGGEVWFQDLPLHQYDEEALNETRKLRVGFIFQFFHLLPTFTVEENVSLPMLLGGERDSGSRTAELLHSVGLTHRRKAMPHQLSGGEMQRVAIARALAHRPPVVIADEPTGNLDSENGEQVLVLLRQMCASRKTAIVMATHSDTAAAAADRILRMRDGRIV